MRTTLVLVLALLSGAAAIAGEHTAAAPLVRFETSAGAFVVELDPEAAPKTVENVLAYVRAGFYDGTVFHRVIPGFMVQGGGFNRDMVQKETRPPVPNEAANGLKNRRGTVAMARTQDPDSATAQFFVNLVDNAFLDRRSARADEAGYTVFGRVVEGMDVVDRIAKVETGVVPARPLGMPRQVPFRDVPLEPVTIVTARVVGDAQSKSGEEPS